MVVGKVQDLKLCKHKLKEFEAEALNDVETLEFFDKIKL